MRDAFPAGGTASDLLDRPSADVNYHADSDQLEAQTATDITEEDRAQIIRDVADQNVTVSAFPKNGGHRLDESAPAIRRGCWMMLKLHGEKAEVSTLYPEKN